MAAPATFLPPSVTTDAGEPDAMPNVSYGLIAGIIFILVLAIVFIYRNRCHENSDVSSEADEKHEDTKRDVSPEHIEALVGSMETSRLESKEKCSYFEKQFKVAGLEAFLLCDRIVKGKLLGKGKDS